MSDRLREHPLLLIHRWWATGLLFLIPFTLGYLIEEPFGITTLNVLSVGFIGLGVLNIIFKNLKPQPLTHKPFQLVLGLLIAAMAYALFFTHPLSNGFGLWTSRLLQPLLVGYVAYLLLESRVMTVGDFIRPLLWSFIPLLIVSLMQVAGLVPYADPGRLSGTFNYANTLARYAVIVLTISLPWILFGVKMGKRFYGGLWIIGVFLLLGTKSYGSTLAFMASTAVTIFLLPKPFMLVKKVALGVGIVGVLVLGFTAPYLPKWQTTINDSRLSRLEFWNIAGHVIQDHFWTGIGIKTWEIHYPELVQRYRTSLPINWLSAQPHNVYLDSFVKAGLPGFIAIVTLLLWPVLEGRALVQSFYTKYAQWWVGLSLAAYGTMMVVLGLIDDPIWSDETMPLLFVFFFALAYTVSHVRTHIKTDS